jgi:DNA-binding NarL/FixJ family response regulator
MEPIRVAAITNNESFLTIVRQWFVIDPGFDFVGWCAPEKLDRLIEAQKPDVLLVDGRIERPLDVCARTLLESRPRIVVLAEEANDLAEFGDLWKMAVLEAGARGVLERGCVASDLAGAVRAVHGGQIWGPRAVVASVLRRRLRSSPETWSGGAHPGASN